MDLPIQTLENVLIVLMAVAATLGFFTQVTRQTLAWLRDVRDGRRALNAETAAAAAAEAQRATQDAATVVLLSNLYVRWRETARDRRYLGLQEALHDVACRGQIEALSYAQVRRWLERTGAVTASAANVALGGSANDDAQTFFTMLGSMLSWPAAISFSPEVTRGED